jgi:hypothetical protein
MAMLDRSLRDGERIIRRLQLAADAVDLARGFAIALMNRRREAPERETTV